ncbi:MAG: glycosyltransferase family 2 protein [Bacteroidota bacterium]
MKKVSIVILNYNGKGYLEQFLPALIQHSTPHEIVVADNASTDDSVELLNNSFPQVRLIALDKNYGYAGGYNEALRLIDSEYLVLVNSDIEVTPGWVEPLIDKLDSNQNIVACQPKIRAFHNKEYFEYAGAAGGFIDWLGYPFCRGRILDNLEKDDGQYDSDIDIFWASGACFAIRKEVFHAAGEFDSGFFAHMEEIDLCWRIQNLGYKISFCHESLVYHVGGGTLSSNNPRKTYLNFRNGLYLLVKNLPFGKLIFTLPVRSFLDLVAAIKFLADGNGKHSLSVFKAHWHAAIPGIKYFMNKAKNRRNNTKLISQKLIVFQYFLRKKKKYSDINFKWEL